MAPRLPETIDPTELARQLHEQGVLLQRLMQTFERMARDGQAGASSPPLSRAVPAVQSAEGDPDTLALVKVRDQLRGNLKERRDELSRLAAKAEELKRVISSSWTSREETNAAKAELPVVVKDHEQERTLVRVLEQRVDKAERELADALHRESLPSKFAPRSESDPDSSRRS